MNGGDAVRTLLAYGAGKPLSHGKTLHLPKRKPKDTLVLALVRMGGESRPWGVAVGRPDREPKVFVASEARDRELVGEMLEQFAPVLLAYLGHPKYKRASRGDHELPSVWLPNSSHIEMLHFLAYTYTFARRGAPERMKVLNALGRASNWLFQESNHPGQMSCIDASNALREAFSFPAEPIRQAHTGYLLGWLEGRGGFEERLNAATEVEQRAISTSLDPQVEKSRLADLVEKFNEAKRAGDARSGQDLARRIREELVPELKHRFGVASRAYMVLARDKRVVNPGVAEVERVALERYQKYVETERSIAKGKSAWITSPDTDRHSLVAASSYVTLDADQTRYINALVHFDEDLQEDLLIGGDGLKGSILEVRDESKGRKTRAVWIVEEDIQRPLRARLGDTLVQAGYAKRKAELRDVVADASRPRRFELEITSGIRAGDGPLGRSPVDKRWKGKKVTFLSLGEPGFSYMRRTMLWDQEGPGTWLTHRQPWEIAATAGGEDDNDADAAGV